MRHMTALTSPLCRSVPFFPEICLHFSILCNAIFHFVFFTAASLLLCCYFPPFPVCRVSPLLLKQVYFYIYIIAQYLVCWTAQSDLHFAPPPPHWQTGTNWTSLGSILAMQQFLATKTNHLYISSAVFSQVLIYTG